MGYTKLFNEIITSTVWQEPLSTKVAWITLLAIKDRHNVAKASIPGLANIAGITIEECEEAIKKLSDPDPYSRTKDFKGRRIEAVDGGWLILNGEKYRNMMSLEDRREYNRIKQREYYQKQRQKASKHSVLSVPIGTNHPPPVHIQIADTNKKKEILLPRAERIQLSERGEWLYFGEDTLKAWTKAFPALNVYLELKKASAWLMANPRNKKRNYERFLVNWLSRAQDKAPPLGGPAPQNWPVPKQELES